MKVLAACHYLDPEIREKIFQVLYKTLEKPNAKLQETAFECMQTFITGCQKCLVRYEFFFFFKYEKTETNFLGPPNCYAFLKKIRRREEPHIKQLKNAFVLNPIVSSSIY